MPGDEGGRVGVLPLAKSVSLPGVGKLDRVCTGVAVKGTRVLVVPGYVRVEGGGGALIRGVWAGLAIGAGIIGAECVVAPVGGTAGRVGARVGWVAAKVGEKGAERGLALGEWGT